MAQETETSSADIAWMRRLAEDSREAPLLHGPILVAAAVIFGLANSLQWAIQSGVWRTEPMTQLWVWLAAGVLFAGALIYLSRGFSRKPGVGAPGNRASGAAWSALGFGIFVLWLSFMAVGFRSGDWTMMWAMPSVVAAAYGSAWIVSGSMMRKRWMTGIGLIGYASAVVFGALIGDATIYLAFLVFLLLTALLPGLALMRQEPKGAA